MMPARDSAQPQRAHQPNCCFFFFMVKSHPWEGPKTPEIIIKLQDKNETSAIQSDRCQPRELLLEAPAGSFGTHVMPFTLRNSTSAAVGNAAL